MMYRAEEVLKLIGPNDRVLDIGGAAEVFPRANAVIDILPYEQRTPGQLKDMPEHFSRDDWYIGDICAPDVWQHFADKEFDFVICSHVLEDIRDPIFVCSQIMRVGKSGYMEFPTRFRECAKASSDDLTTGWEHHRWIIDVEGGTLIFKAKLDWAHHYDYLGDGRRTYYLDYFHQFNAIQWMGSFDYVERVSKTSVLESENLFYFYDHYSYTQPAIFHLIDNVVHKGRTFEWIDQYKLPIEEKYTFEQIRAMHDARVKDPAYFGLHVAARRRLNATMRPTGVSIRGKYIRLPYVIVRILQKINGFRRL